MKRNLRHIIISAATALVTLTSCGPFYPSVSVGADLYGDDYYNGYNVGPSFDYTLNTPPPPVYLPAPDYQPLPPPRPQPPVNVPPQSPGNRPGGGQPGFNPGPSSGSNNPNSRPQNGGFRGNHQ
ncbi:MAG: hypothetical protein K2N91_01405 [Muribaculaceae bacterium]|nr:hypothetical protein [Muribaculaceae bacterium]